MPPFGTLTLFNTAVDLDSVPSSDSFETHFFDNESVTKGSAVKPRFFVSESMIESKVEQTKAADFLVLVLVETKSAYGQRNFRNKEWSG